jgi:hypothetical protein
VQIRGLVVADLLDPVGAVAEDADALPALALLVVHLHVAADDDQVERLDQVGGRAVDADLSGARLALDHVGLQPVSVRDVVDVDQLVGEHLRPVHQVAIDRHGSLVLDIGLGDRGAVDLRLQHGSYHGESSI